MSDSEVFRFKQFSINQTGCAMKVNTDGVLLGALAQQYSPQNILDIGAGTGVIALMLAQRFPDAQVYAAEIDATAAQTARQNFSQSIHHHRLHIYEGDYKDLLAQDVSAKFDLIVSNPPFYLHSLKPLKADKAMAKHAGEEFFIILLEQLSQYLFADGTAWLILPVSTANLVKKLAATQQLNVLQRVYIKSYPDSKPHREILSLGFMKTETMESELYIYEAPKVYGEQYRLLLTDFLTIF